MQQRRPRFERAPAAGIELQARDRTIIREVFRHRFLTSRHITALVGGSEQVVLRRLRLLYDAAFLDRPRAQVRYFSRTGNRPIVFGIGNRGADLLAAELSIPRSKVDWTTKNREAGERFIEHTLLVSDVLVGIALACRTHPSVRFIPAEEIIAASPPETRRAKAPLGWRVRATFEGVRASVPVFPDGAFGLHFTEEPEGRNRVYFFLEADRSTMSVNPAGLNLGKSTFFRKLLGYYETWHQGVHTVRFGIKNFRVLTVTGSEATRARIETMLAANRRLGHGDGYRIFLFTTAEALLAGDPLEHQWVNGRDELVRLVD